MPTFLFAQAFASTLALAAAALDPGGTYVVKKELKGAGTAPEAIAHARAEMKSELESYDLTEGKPVLLLVNKTEQLMALRTLPKSDPKKNGAQGGAKESAQPPAEPGLEHALELTFEALKSSSEVHISGMPRPFVTKTDLGAVLSKTPLVIRGDGKTAKKVEGLAAARAAALAQVKDPVGRNTVNGLFDEAVLLRTSSATSTGGCLAAFGKKAPGERWEFSVTEQGATLSYDCEFEGWAEASGKKIAVVKITLRKNRQVRQQPSGVPGIAETSGQGRLYFLPATNESLQKMETEILVEPTEVEISKLKARGEKVPRNRTRMRHWNRLFPI